MLSYASPFLREAPTPDPPVSPSSRVHQAPGRVLMDEERPGSLATRAMVAMWPPCGRCGAAPRGEAFWGGGAWMAVETTRPGLIRCQRQEEGGESWINDSRRWEWPWVPC